MLKRATKKRFISEINVVPYIDVMLVLLVIFMVTAPLLQQGVAVDLPKAKAHALPSGQHEAVVVSINQVGEYFLNTAHTPNDPISAPSLKKSIGQMLRDDPDRHIVVKGDKQVDYGKVVEAMVLLQQSGVANVGLLTQND